MADPLKYPIGVQEFPKLRERGFVYIDKTQFIQPLLDGAGYYFLSRPRRFGKSLFISTLEAFFQGRQELFKGLAIDTPDTVWEERPVITISLNTVDPQSEDALRKHLDVIFRNYEEFYGIEDNGDELSSRFEQILRKAYQQTGKKVAVLIDEYDGPILDTLEMEERNTSYRLTLKSIFSVLKSADRYIHFASSQVFRVSAIQAFSAESTILKTFPFWMNSQESAASQKRNFRPISHPASRNSPDSKALTPTPCLHCLRKTTTAITSRSAAPISIILKAFSAH